jgi:hypothetical protein
VGQETEVGLIAGANTDIVDATELGGAEGLQPS